MGLKNNGINKVALFNLLGPALLNGLSFFTMPLFTRLLGTEQYGIYVNYASFLSIFAVIIGFQAAGSVAPASVHYDQSERDACFSSIMTAALASALLIGAVYFAFLPTSASLLGMPAHLAAVLFFHATGQFIVNFTTAKFSYDKRSHITFMVSVGVSVSSILLSIAAIYLLDGVMPASESYIIGHAIPNIVVGAVFAVYFLLKGRVFFKKEYWRFALTLCLPLIFHQLSNTLLHQCDKIMLDRMTTKTLVGIYGFAVTFANVISIIWSALNTTFVPFYHDDIREGKEEQLHSRTKNYLFLFTVLTVGFIYAQPEVVRLFAQKDFFPSSGIIPLLTLGLYFVFLYSFPVNFEFFYCKTRIIAVGTCFAAVANITLNYLLIPYCGMYGAAAATVTSYVLLWILHLLLARFVIKKPYHFKYREFYIYLAITVVATALFYAVKDMWYIRWPVCLALGIALICKIKKQRALF